MPPIARSPDPSVAGDRAPLRAWDGHRSRLRARPDSAAQTITAARNAGYAGAGAPGTGIVGTRFTSLYSR